MPRRVLCVVVADQVRIVFQRQAYLAATLINALLKFLREDIGKVVPAHVLPGVFEKKCEWKIQLRILFSRPFRRSLDQIVTAMWLRHSLGIEGLSDQSKAEGS